MLYTLPRPGSGLQTMPGSGNVLSAACAEPDPAVFTAAVARYRALEKLRDFRSRLYGCLALRADALFELVGAVMCADHAVTSLVQLSLEPEFTRGHGALYDALSAGRIDDERLFSLLAPELPQAVDGPQALAWIAAGSVFCAGPVTWEGKYGRPARRGAAVHCPEPADFAAAAGGSGPRGRKEPLPPDPGPDEELTLPGTPLYGTVRAGAWHRVHPLIHGDRGWFAGRKKLPVLPGALIHVTVERLPDGRGPHRAMWLWHAGPGPLPLDEPWRACLARSGIEHVFKFLKGILGLTAAKVRGPGQADRWIRLLMAAHAQLLLARPLAAGLRRPWERQPGPGPAAGTGPGPPRVPQHPP